MITILPPEIANRIAAGEVVERPASVVRELIDNALDAGASRIDVEVREGGLKLIRVADDGGGMSPEDAVLCVRRHATSKIKSAEDLERIATKGFRGEALAAIGSVSRLELRTRRREDELGVRVEVEGGIERPHESVGAAVGTAVTVRDLFFNTPARRKFLKKPPTEMSHILTAVNCHALAHEGVHFTFTHNGRRTLDLPAVANRPERIRQVFDESLLSEMIPAQFDSPVITVSGLISRPTLTRNGAQHFFFFINNRYVKDRLLHRAVVNGYRNLIPHGRFPVVFLYIDIDPGEIDVNVHPTKQEIKFSREDAVYSAVYGVVRDAWDKREEARQETQSIFQRLEGAPARSQSPSRVIPMPQRPNPEVSSPARSPSNDSSRETHPPRMHPPHAREANIKPEDPTCAPESASKQKKEDRAIDAAKSNPVEALNRKPLGSAGESLAPPATALSRSSRPSGSAFEELIASQTNLDASFSTASLEGVEPLTVCGQVMNSYIVAQSRDGLYLIDQHAAHERLMFEEFLTKSRNASLSSQPLLFPITVDLAPDEAAMLAEEQETLKRLGFEVEAFGPKTYAIRAIPSKLNIDDADQFLKDLLGEWRHEGSADERRERALHTMACRAAVKFGDALNQEEMSAIVRGLESIPRRNVCPHGRPAVLYISDASLRKLFKRTGFD